MTKVAENILTQVHQLNRSELWAIADEVLMLLRQHEELAQLKIPDGLQQLMREEREKPHATQDPFETLSELRRSL